MSLALLVAGAAFAQQVGDTCTLGGQTYVVESVSGDKVTLKKQKGNNRWDDRRDDKNSGGQQDGGRRPGGREQWVTDLPTNVNVAFQTALTSASSKDGFLSPSVDILKDGTPIALRNMNGREPQNNVRPFRLVHSGEGWYQIKNNGYGVLDLPGNTSSNDRQLQLYKENNSYKGEHQRFRIARVGNGLYQIYTSNGKNLQVRNNKTTDLTPVVQKTGSLSDSNESAMWRIYTINRGNLTPLN
jgi:hypothetical protein